MKGCVLLGRIINTKEITVLRVYRKEHYEQAKKDRTMLSKDFTSKQEFILCEVEVFSPNEKDAENETDHRPLFEVMANGSIDQEVLDSLGLKFHHAKDVAGFITFHYELPYGEMDCLEYLRAVGNAMDTLRGIKEVRDMHFIQINRNILLEKP